MMDLILISIGQIIDIRIKHHNGKENTLHVKIIIQIYILQYMHIPY